MLKVRFYLSVLLALVVSAPSAFAQKTVELELSHHLPAVRAAALKRSVDQFHKQNSNIRIKLVQRSWQDKTPPHMMILSEAEEEAFLTGPVRYKPLDAMMRGAGVPLDVGRAIPFMTRTPVDDKGRLKALPVGLSTPILFLNRDAFRRAGLNPAAVPLTSFADLQKALGQLADTGHACPYTIEDPARVMVENTSAWHNVPVTTKRGSSVVPAFNTMFQIKHVAHMASWNRAQYLHFFSPGEADARFAFGECAVIATSSANWPIFRHSGIDIDVAPLPFHDDYVNDSQNTLADGLSMWFAAGKSTAEYKAMAAFVKYWLTPVNQIDWQRDAGYLPLNLAGLLPSQATTLGDELAHIRVATYQLLKKKPTANSSFQPSVERPQVRRILDEELTYVWADTKAAKAALDAANERAGKIK